MEVKYLLSISSMIHVLTLGIVTFLIKSWIKDVKDEQKECIDKLVDLQLKVNTLETTSELEHRRE